VIYGRHHYKVKVRGGKEKVFHVNMLKVWHERVEKDKDNDVQTDIAACLNVISGLSTDVCSIIFVT
jgi:hypothetical protein